MHAYVYVYVYVHGCSKKAGYLEGFGERSVLPEIKTVWEGGLEDSRPTLKSHLGCRLPSAGVALQAEPDPG